MQAICESLQRRGYRAAWLVLMDSSNEPSSVAYYSVGGGKHTVPSIPLKKSPNSVLDCFELNKKIELSDGSWALCMVTAPNYMVTRESEEEPVFDEITREIKGALQNIQNEERARNLQIVSKIPELMSLVSREFRYIVVNDSYQDYFGVPVSEFRLESIELL